MESMNDIEHELQVVEEKLVATQQVCVPFS
jgi:hypothetical protein